MKHGQVLYYHIYSTDYLLVVGYPMSNHAGYMYGYHSLVTVYPDLKLAIFTCDNGEEADALNPIHDFITDALMPVQSETSGNAQQNVVQPDQGLVRIKYAQGRGMREGSDRENRRTRKSVAPSTRAIDEYVGIYGNFAFGNVTITLSPTTNRLVGTYGNLVTLDMFLNPVTQDNFFGTAADPLWFFPPMALEFGRNESAGGAVETVTVPIFLTEDPPVFVRGLRMSDAPSPPVA